MEELVTGYVRAVDNVGNWGATDSDTITYDSGIPVFTSPNPADDATGEDTEPTCNVTATDPYGAGMNITFASNYSDGITWVNYQTNTSVGNGSYSWSFTAASTEATNYWWRVYINNTHTVTEVEYGANISKTYKFTTGYSTWSKSLNTNSYDYFVWRGINCTAYDIAVALSNFGTDDDSNIAEYIAIWNASATPYPLWSTYYGDGSGVNFTITSYMVIRTYLLGDNPSSITDTVQTTWNGPSTKTLTNTSDNKGYDYTGYMSSTSQVLSDIVGTYFNTTLEDYSWIAVWAGTAWQYYIEGFYDSGATVNQYDVVISKITKSITWTL